MAEVLLILHKTLNSQYFYARYVACPCKYIFAIKASYLPTLISALADLSIIDKSYCPFLILAMKKSYSDEQNSVVCKTPKILKRMVLFKQEFIRCLGISGHVT